MLVWLRFGLWLAPRKTNSEEWRARGESRDGEIAMSRCKRLHQTSKAVRDRLLRSLAPGDSRPTRPKNFSKSEKPVDGGSRRVQTQKEEPLRLQLVTPAYVPRGSLIQHWFYAAKRGGLARWAVVRGPTAVERRTALATASMGQGLPSCLLLQVRMLIDAMVVDGPINKSCFPGRSHGG